MNKKKNRKGWGWIIFIALFAALFIRIFLFESYRISSAHMEDSLFKGDYVLSSKLHYGIRLPQTLFSIPFLHDTVPGLNIPAYKTYCQAPYKRIGSGKIDRNDVVIFNRPLRNEEAIIPVDKRKIEISRCIGLPGDTLRQAIRNNAYTWSVNGNWAAESPTVKNFYSFPYLKIKQVEKVAGKAGIKSFNYYYTFGDSLAYCMLNQLQHYKMESELPGFFSLYSYPMQVDTTTFVLPHRQQKITLSEENISFYAPIICNHEPVKARFVNDNIFIDGKKTRSYTFRYDYYWMVSDNREILNDSRTFGVVPETHINGKAWYVWLSFDAKRTNGFFRWQRLFRQVQ